MRIVFSLTIMVLALWNANMPMASLRQTNSIKKYGEKKMKTKDTYFTHSDGTPLLWIADTAWNTALRSDEDDWKEYLETREKQGFTVIQFVTTQWRGCRNPIHGNLYNEDKDKISFNSKPFAKMDRWIEMINDHNMVAAPVMLWANQAECPGKALSVESCIKLGRYMVERWKDHNMVWLLAGDSNYESEEQATRWKSIGRGIFADYPDEIVTMHPCGISWVGDIFAEEDWYSFVGIQSGHGKSQSNLDWLLRGPFSTSWKSIPKPFVNIEPNYETAIAYGTQQKFTAYHVRRASYWSMLSAPTAGITYGHNSIWVWGQKKDEFAEGHGKNWVAQPWREALETEGIKSLAILKSIFEKLPWTELSPAPELLISQPGNDKLAAFVTVAATKQRNCLIAYLPKGGEINIRTEMLESSLNAFWVNPGNGEWTQTENKSPFTAPDGGDWLLVLNQ